MESHFSFVFLGELCAFARDHLRLEGHSLHGLAVGPITSTGPSTGLLSGRLARFLAFRLGAIPRFQSRFWPF